MGYVVSASESTLAATKPRSAGGVTVRVKMINYLPGADEWQNDIVWQDVPVEEYLADVELIKYGKTFKEYPLIEIPQCLLDAGFEDHSWHNDTCAQAELCLKKQGTEGGRFLRVWVDYVDPDKRELGLEGKRFVIMLIERSEDGGNETELVLGETELEYMLARLISGVRFVNHKE